MVDDLQCDDVRMMAMMWGGWTWMVGCKEGRSAEGCSRAGGSAASQRLALGGMSVREQQGWRQRCISAVSVGWCAWQEQQGWWQPAALSAAGQRLALGGTSIREQQGAAVCLCCYCLVCVAVGRLPAP